MDLVEITALTRRQLGLARQVREAHDCVHRRAYLVAHVRQKMAFEAVGLLRLVLGLRQGRLLPPHLCNPQQRQQHHNRRSADHLP